MPVDYFGGGDGGNEAERRKREAIVDPLINRPTSNLMDKGKAAMSGFMQTSALGSMGGGGGFGGEGMMGGGAGAGAAGGAEIPITGTPTPNPGTTAGSTGQATNTPPPDISFGQAAQKWTQSPFGSAAEAAGMSPSAAQSLQTLVDILKSQQSDPNQASKNIGRIAGIASRFFTG